MREVHQTDRAPRAIGPYSQAVRAEGKLFFMSGQIPLLPNGELLEGTVAEQARQCLENMKALLESAGLSLANVVKTTVFLADMADFAAMNEVYARYFDASPPARSAVAVKTLPKNVAVEIEAIAVF